MKKEVNVIPASGKILVTADKETTTASGLILASGGGFEYKELQRVVAVGRDCSPDIMEWDIVAINKKNYAKLKYQEDSIKSDINGNHTVEYIYPIEIFNGKEYMLLNAFSDIKYIIPVNEAHFSQEELTERQGIVTGMPIV